MMLMLMMMIEDRSWRGLLSVAAQDISVLLTAGSRRRFKQEEKILSNKGDLTWNRQMVGQAKTAEGLSTRQFTGNNGTSLDSTPFKCPSPP